MLHALKLKLGASRPLIHTRIFRRSYAAQPFGLLPKGVVENAKRAVASTQSGTVKEDDEMVQRSTPSAEEWEALKRKRRTDWKRRQGVSALLD